MGGLVCGQLGGLTSKTNLTYHVAKLREAGVVNVRPEGTQRPCRLRRDDLDRPLSGLSRQRHRHAPSTCPLVDSALHKLDLPEDLANA